MGKQLIKSITLHFKLLFLFRYPHTIKATCTAGSKALPFGEGWVRSDKSCYLQTAHKKYQWLFI